jgi:hypothetical protein
MDPAWWRIWADRSGRGSGSGRLTEPLVPGFRWPAVLGEEPARLPEDHWWVESLAHAWPAGSTGSHENAADIGVSLWTDHAGSRPLLPGLRMGCRMQRPATDKPASSWPGAPVSFGLLLTWDVPAVDLLCTSRDGTDDGEQSKRTCYLRNPDDQPVPQRPASRPAEPAG